MTLLPPRYRARQDLTAPPKHPRNASKIAVAARICVAASTLSSVPCRSWVHAPYSPPDTPLGRALREWRESLIADLGGPDSITTQQLALVDMAVRSKLLVDSVDAYVLGMPSAVNKRSRCLYPVVKERQALVSQIQSLLRDLGLERRAKAPLDLSTYLATKGGGNARAPGTGGGGGGSSALPISFEHSNTDSQEPLAGD